MKKVFKVTCKSCGHTWYPSDEKRWKENPDAPEPDCVNPQCIYFGTGFHPAEQHIWIEGYEKGW